MAGAAALVTRAAILPLLDGEQRDVGGFPPGTEGKLRSDGSDGATVAVPLGEHEMGYTRALAPAPPSEKSIGTGAGVEGQGPLAAE